ncbi:hypothetical protein VNI00_000751 [Paramarasmius palmivorus]|uniref:Uncharacterized protein n=1 Tax=Paramarasmius palmivorus TaxID=297713 RepID=A0AAW0EBC8_9AGAR
MPGSHSSGDYAQYPNESPTQSLGSKPDGVLSSSEDTTTSEDGGNFRASLQIDMNRLVGDAVGNMSISPASRDVVLAAYDSLRRGLFIIDLKSPFEVPRFLPQGGTWDVADVQWNPHHRRAEYIVSTSSEKLLIWNLLMPGKTSIEHILHSHYRAITDINWHTTECDTVASTGIDSWVWAWDLRETRKPIFGLSAFNAPGTQVKWNKRDANILASSHGNEVLIWDRRKGSLPITVIRGHKSRIYGIDWSHRLRNEIVTCSLDKTIKVWDIENYAPNPQFGPRSRSLNTTYLEAEPKYEIQTTYPVWRARNLPFGKGVLSLPQRSETALEMYSINEGSAEDLVRTFEGHNDVVKEFVWRKGGQNGNEFQLITWSKDRTLRFWPIYQDTLQKVGCDPSQSDPASSARSSAAEQSNSTISFRNPPSQSETLPLLSAPIGNRAILAEVRAGMPPRQRNALYTATDTHEPFGSRENQFAPGSAPGVSSSADTLHAVPLTLRTNFKRNISSSYVNSTGGGTMSRGAAGNKSRANVDPLSWLSSVKVGDGRRGSSSGPGSQGGSNDGSRVRSGSRETGSQDNSSTAPPLLGTKRRRSDSQTRPVVEEKDTGQSLQDEITSVLTKLSSTSKIRLEKHDLTKKRTCTLGLQVPWVASSSVFMRVTFTFPRDYPHAVHPEGTPTVELDRTPLISIKDRAAILRRLRTIREKRRPCLEACLRFLLLGIEDEQAEAPLLLESESSSDEDGRPQPKRMTSSLIRNSKNLAEPRTSQGTFGPNGELVCFFAAPPRIIRSLPHGLSKSPSKSSDNAEERAEDSPSRIFQSPTLVTDAIRRLSSAASDRLPKAEVRRSESGEQLTRIMTNLLTFSRHRRPSFQESAHSGEASNSYVMPSRRSTVVITSTLTIAGSDKTVASDYIFLAPNASSLCDQNATFARLHGRYDHERIFRTLGAILSAWAQIDLPHDKSSGYLVKQTVSRLLLELRNQRDIQMLAMVSAILLQAFALSPPLTKDRVQTPKVPNSAQNPLLAKLASTDYFSIPRRRTFSSHASPNSPTWTPRPPSEVSGYNGGPASSGSRGSWSSLFNPGNVRHLMPGMQDTKDGIAPESISPTPGPWIPVPLRKRAIHEPDSPVPRHRVPRRDSINTVPSPVSKSWSETIPSIKGAVSFSSEAHRMAMNMNKRRSIATKKKIIVFDDQSLEPVQETVFEKEELSALLAHVHAYAEILFRWQLYHKRLELLKSVKEPTPYEHGSHAIG